jgi:hypothetical protein
MQINTDTLSTEDTLHNFANHYNLSYNHETDSAHDIFTKFYNKFVEYKENHKICMIFESKCNVHSYPDFTKFSQLQYPPKLNTLGEKYELKKQNFTINDFVKFTYLPFSQKYLDYYESINRMGNIIFIDNSNNDMIIWSIKDNNIVFQSMVVDGRSYSVMIN